MEAPLLVPEFPPCRVIPKALTVCRPVPVLKMLVPNPFVGAVPPVIESEPLVEIV